MKIYLVKIHTNITLLINRLMNKKNIFQLICAPSIPWFESHIMTMLHHQEQLTECLNLFPNKIFDIMIYLTSINNGIFVDMILKKFYTNPTICDYRYLLKVAIWYNIIDMIKYFIDCIDDINYDNGYALKVCCHSPLTTPETLVLFLNSGVNIHIDDDSPLRICVKEHKSNFVKILLEANANVHANNDHALMLSACHFGEKMVLTLLEYQADIHAQNDKALIISVRAGSCSVAKILLEANINVCAKNNKSIITAVTNLNIKMVNLLLLHGANLLSLKNYIVPDTHDEQARLKMMILLENQGIEPHKILSLLTTGRSFYIGAKKLKSGLEYTRK